MVGGLMSMFEQSMGAMGNQAVAKGTGMEKRLSAAEQSVDKLINGTLLWDIDRFDERRKNCDIVWSEYFYAKMQPYKMALRMHTSGFCIDNGSGLTIYLLIYDDYRNTWITWPFAADVTITIRNKATPEVCEMITEHCIIQKPDINSHKWADPFQFLYSDFSSVSLFDSNRLLVECRVDLR